jgi:phosphoglycolate phosphatase
MATPHPHPLIILDFDGTLGDTQRLIVSTMQQTLRRLHLPPKSDQECAAMIGLPLKQTFTNLIAMSDEMGDLCEQTYREIFVENNKPGAVDLFPYVEKTLHQLHHQGCILTIASSRSRPSLAGFIKDMRLENIISYIVAGDEVDRAKPYPDMVIKTLEHTGMDAADTLVVGDTAYDILMGKRALCHTVGVTYGNGTAQQLAEAGADWLIDRFDRLVETVNFFNNL